MAKDSKRKTRKRRSFWEPESKELVAWLNSQADLGKSLQLIIVDAIHQYGRGDAVDAYLQRRIDGDFKSERPVEHSDVPMAGQSLHGPVSPGVLPLDVPDIDDPPNELEPSVELALDSESAPDVELDDDLDIADEETVESKPEDKPAKVEPAQEEEYDPLETMFADIDSGFDK